MVITIYKLIFIIIDYIYLVLYIERKIIKCMEKRNNDILKLFGVLALGIALAASLSKDLSIYIR